MSTVVTAVNTTEFPRVIAESETPVVVDFWASWCGPCRMLAPELDKFAERMGARARVVKVNVDENPGLAAQNQVMGIPTLVIFHHGKEIGRHTGYTSADALARSLEAYLTAAV